MAGGLQNFPAQQELEATAAQRHAIELSVLIAEAAGPHSSSLEELEGSHDLFSVGPKRHTASHSLQPFLYKLIQLFFFSEHRQEPTYL